MLLVGDKSQWVVIAFLVLTPVLGVMMASVPLAAGPEPFLSPIPGTTTCVSISSSGAQANSYSNGPAISAEGRYVAFESRATNLVSGDTNGRQDIFVHDRETEETTRVSVASDGSQANGYSEAASISGDGQRIAFASAASNLVISDTNRVWDVFVRDRETGQTTRVSVASDGGQGNANALWPAISADGRYVAFDSRASTLVISDTNRATDVFVHDLETGETTRVSVGPEGGEGNDDSMFSSISADGRLVAFVSQANNLVVEDNNGFDDIFVHDRHTGETSLVSVASDGSQAQCRWRLCSWHPAISADGRYVAFVSYADNLVDGDTNHTADVFIHDRQHGETRRVSVASDGSQGSYAQAPALSGDGRLVTFWSYASNLVSDDANGWVADVFIRDREMSRTSLASISSSGVQGNAGSRASAISVDGCCVAFGSAANNLVRGDDNGMEDIFVRDLEIDGQDD